LKSGLKTLVCRFADFFADIIEFSNRSKKFKQKGRLQLIEAFLFLKD